MIKETMQPAVYIMANKRNGTLYTGVTSDLPKRIYEHKNEIKAGFSSKYECKTLVYFCLFGSMETAILEEKRLKGGNRKQKLTLIETMNLTGGIYMRIYSNLLIIKPL